jgi:serine/threonine-protein kinase
LRLSASSLPEGLTFTDLGQGRGLIEGAPKQSGTASLRIDATDHNGRIASIETTITVGEKPRPPTLEPPQPSVPQAVLGGATVGENYSADLPAFSASANAGAITVRAASDPPAGLDLTNLGPGLARLTGKPSRAGSYSFEVVATNAAGPSSPMTVKLEVTPAQGTEVKANAFLKKFDGGDCFLVKPQVGTAFAYLGIGLEGETFDRFEKDFKQEVGIEPHLIRRLITRPECPVLNLMRPGPDEAAAPRIELSAPSVDRNKPLAGTITNLRSRRLYVILVDNDGGAYRLDAKIQPGGDAATLSQFLTPDPGSVGPTQLIFAIVSRKPIPVLESLGRAGALAKTIAPALGEAAKSGEASVGADFFVLLN